MRYSNIIYNDIVNTDSVSLTFYCQGCSHHCNDCFQSETWDFNGGNILTENVIENIKYCLKNYKYDYLCLLGGEPLDNIDVCKYIINLCKSYQKDINVWLYTGYLISDNKHIEIEKDLNVIVDGKFEKDLYDTRLVHRGSSNQNIYKKINGVWEKQ